MNFKFKKTEKMGTYTVAISLILLAAIVLVNMVVAAIPTKYTIIDTSLNKIYSISEETEKAMRNLNESVTIYCLCPGGVPNDTLQTFIERYSAESSYISIKIVDPIESPAFVMNYTEEELTDYSLIIESAKRFKVIDYNDIYELDIYSYYYYGEYNYSFNGERLITSAIDYVTTDVLPKIYTLEGHNEAALSDTLKTQIEDMNYTVESLSLLTKSEVPEDASAVIINSPSSDINEDDAEKLIRYLDNGGSLFLITSAASKSLTNISKVTAYYGLTMKENIIIEGDSGNCIPGMPYWMLPDIASHSITSSLSATTYMQIPYAHPIVVKTVDGVKTTSLFTTSESAYTVLPTAQNTNKTDDSEVGSFTIGAIAEATEGGKLLWIASNYTFVDQANSYSSGANYKYFLSSLSYLSPKSSILIDIPAVSITNPMLTVTEKGASFWGTTLTFIIPLAFLGTGVVKWMLRRRK